MSACLNCGAELAGTHKFCPECGAKVDVLAEQPHEARKVVTVLFSDVTGSTALGEQLDPEAVRTLMGRYFAAMKTVIERHGGRVEKFIGDAVMAVFGVPALHEDDALRAVRAAVEMRDALAGLNAELAAEQGVMIETRTGITTGEVVAGDPAEGQTLVTGDTVNTAARLEQAAAPGVVLIGEPTWRLVRDAVTAERADDVTAKGKALPVAAYRLISVQAGAEGHQRRVDAPMVGRKRELARLLQTYRDAVEDRSPQLFTLLGSAGVGKSRLVREFANAVEAESRILRGRCLPYGEGITYWPLAEALREAAGITDQDDRATAQDKLLGLLEDSTDAEVLSVRLATAIGLSDEAAPQTELFWAARRTFEHIAHQRSLVLVFEDVHWAEPTFLDLIDHLSEWTRDAPLFLLATARPELLDVRPGWGGGKLNTTSVLLEALPPDATAQLIDALPGGAALPQTLRSRITASAEGNPLFVEELLGMLIDDGVLREIDGRWAAADGLEQLAIPPTIHALLAARLDRLTPDERQVAERASVVGRVFEPEAVAALSADGKGSSPMPELMALMRKELVRPDHSEVTGGDAFKFRHILIRDAAYNALPKRERVELHQRFASWLEHVVGDRAAEFAEIIGHHLETAYRYELELGAPSSPALRMHGSAWLAGAADRAWDRSDYASAATLYSRAADMAISIDERLRLKEEAVGCLLARSEWEQAKAAAAALSVAAEGAANEGTALRAQLLVANSDTMLDPAAVASLEEMLPSALRRLEELDDVAGIALARMLESLVHAVSLRWDQAHAALERALGYASRSGSKALLTDIVRSMTGTAGFGSTPLSAIREEVARIERDFPAAWTIRDAALVDAYVTILEAGFDAAKPAIDRLRRLFTEVGDLRPLSTGIPADLSILARDVGEVAASVELAEESERGMAEVGGQDNFRRTSAAIAAEGLATLGRIDEAENYLADALEADERDIVTHVMAHRAQARIAIHLGRLTDAEAEANAALGLLEGAEAPNEYAEALITLAEVKVAQGARAEAQAALSTALDLMAAKGATAVVRRIEALLAPLE